MEENIEKDIIFNELIELFSFDYLFPDRLLLITSIWEMYNDHLLIKVNHYSGTRFELTERAREF